MENTLPEGLSEREQKMAVPKVSQEAWYRELYAGVDLQVYLCHGAQGKLDPEG